ncbi:hypothetical protein BH11PSE11_BH11PSE11_16020 [soil metagenome]
MLFARIVAIAALAMPAAAGLAQENSPPPDPVNPANPANPAATVPGTVYQSAFRDYLPYRPSEEPPAKIWRAANETVKEVGGHGAHGTEAVMPQSSAPASSTVDSKPVLPKPAAVDHSMHRHEGK